MDYQDFITEVRGLGFVQDDETADAMVKAVLGIFASAMREPQARQFTKKLPGPLSLDELRGHQQKVALMIPVDAYIREIACQFKLQSEQAEKLIRMVLHRAKRVAGDEVISDAENKITDDWRKLLESV